jgi:hypothetical protein
MLCDDGKFPRGCGVGIRGLTDAEARDEGRRNDLGICSTKTT